MSEAAFKPTPERVEADRRAPAAEVARVKALTASHGPPARPVTLEREAVDLGATLQRIIANNRALEERRQSLPCVQPLAEGDADAAVDACESERAHESCEWRDEYAFCPRMRAPDAFGEVKQRMSRGQVEARETEVLLAAARRRDRVPLRELDSLRLVRALLRRQRMRVAFENAAEVRLPEGTEHSGEAFLTGAEAIIALCGNQGRGKTLAVCYAIARLGGYYTRAADWTLRGVVDLDLAVAAPVLVVDQFGREDWGTSDWARSHHENVLDKRYQRRRFTFLVGNLTWNAFRAHMDKHLNKSTITDRLAGDGLFVVFGGPSIRGELRAAALEARP